MVSGNVPQFSVYVSQSGDIAFSAGIKAIMGNTQYVQLFHEPAEKKVAIALSPTSKIDSGIFDVKENNLLIKTKAGIPYIEAWQFFKDFNIPIEEGGHRCLWSPVTQMFVFSLDSFEFKPKRRS